jgi:hypothetical protein
MSLRQIVAPLKDKAKLMSQRFNGAAELRHEKIWLGNR